MSPLDKILAILQADAPSTRGGCPACVPPVAPLDYAIPEERPATAAAFAASVGEFFEAASDEEAQSAALWLMGFTRSLAEGLALEAKAAAPVAAPTPDPIPARKFMDPAGNLFESNGEPLPPATPETVEPGSDVSCGAHDES